MAKTKVKKTPKQKGKTALKVLLCIVIIIAVIAAAVAITNVVSYSSNRNFIKESIPAVEYDDQLVPKLGDDGYYTFVTDDEFKILQLTDVHLGGGCLSTEKDNMAINAVAAMITAEKPDLVVVTGDIAYPMPHQAGTLNNKSSAVTFAQLMEKLGVYWCNVYGNHDTEVYSYHSRKDISKTVYGDKEKYPHCLFQAGPEEADGEGNYVINIRNSTGEIIQSLFMFDSHSYVDGDYFGFLWKYDAVHENQVKWYKETVAALTEENAGITPKSLAFFHIPLREMKDAAQEYRDNDFNDTENVKYIEGKLGESDMVVCSGLYNYGLFDAFKETGSTQGVFFGHDHLNNMSLDYKGIRLTYGYSIDYLAYSGIYKYGLQRGCTVINVEPDSTLNYHHENYYQDKYQSVNEKEDAILDHDMADDYGSAGAMFEFQEDNNL